MIAFKFHNVSRSETRKPRVLRAGTIVAEKMTATITKFVLSYSEL